MNRFMTDIDKSGLRIGDSERAWGWLDSQLQGRQIDGRCDWFIEIEYFGYGYLNEGYVKAILTEWLEGMMTKGVMEESKGFNDI